MSSSRQKTSGELARQQEVLKYYCRKKAYCISGEYSDDGSGLNDSRRGLLALLRDVSRRHHDVVVVNYRDRHQVSARVSALLLKQHVEAETIAGS